MPQAHKNAENTIESLQQFQGTDKIRSFRCDNSQELKAAARELKWPKDTSTPGVPQTNGLAERWVRTSKEGTAATRLRGGASIQWSRFAGPCFAFHHNIAGKQESPYCKRHGVECNAAKIPFFAQVEFMPTPETEETSHSMGPKVLDGLFLGYHSHAGGKWSGDYYVAEFEPFRNNPDLTPTNARVHRVKECTLPADKRINFPLADYRLQLRKIDPTGLRSPELPEDAQNSDSPKSETADLPQESPTVDASTSRDGTKAISTAEASTAAADSVAPGADLRGQGGVVDGQVVRRYAGDKRKSQRPPDIHPEVWATFGPKVKKEFTDQYLAKLEAARSGNPVVKAKDAAAASKPLSYREWDDVHARQADLTTLGENSIYLAGEVPEKDRQLWTKPCHQTSYYPGMYDDYDTAFDCQGSRCLGDLAKSDIPGARNFAASDCIVLFSGWLGQDPGKTLKSWATKLWQHAEAGGTSVLFAPAAEANVFRGDGTIGYVYGDSLLEYTDKKHGLTLLTTNPIIKQAFQGRVAEKDMSRHPHWRVYVSCIEGNGVKVRTEADQMIGFHQDLVRQEYENRHNHTTMKKPAPAAAVVPVVRLPGQMPVVPLDLSHRVKEPDWSPCIPSAVARKVGRAEVERVPDAAAAVDKEWDKLAKMPHPDGKGFGVWDISKVEEKWVVAKRFREMGKKGSFRESCRALFSERLRVARRRSSEEVQG